MSEKIQLRLPTGALKSILGENPEALIELEKRACEKVAEELRRKVSASLKEMTDQKVKEWVGRALSRAGQQFQSKYSFPLEARSVIRDEIEELLGVETKRQTKVVEAALAKAVEKQMDSAGHNLTIAVSKLMNDASDKLEADTKKWAREAFFEVLAEAKATQS